MVFAHIHERGLIMYMECLLKQNRYVPNLNELIMYSKDCSNHLNSQSVGIVECLNSGRRAGILSDVAG